MLLVIQEKKKKMACSWLPLCHIVPLHSNRCTDMNLSAAYICLFQSFGFLLLCAEIYFLSLMMGSKNIFAVMTYMPQDFRGSLIRQQRERSERNKQAEVDALINSGGSIHDRYTLLWKQQMER